MLQRGFALAASALGLAFGGCVATPPPMTMSRATELLAAHAPEQKIPIRSFQLESADRVEETKNEGSGLPGSDVHAVFFPKQAREFLAQDLKDYVASRFMIDPAATTALIIKLDQAQCFVRVHFSGANWVPVVGMFTLKNDLTKPVPVTFLAEATLSFASATAPAAEAKTFVARSETIPGNTPIEQFRGVYSRELTQVRQALFERLDAQIGVRWQEGHWVAPPGSSPASAAAELTSETERLNVALAEQKISQADHDQKLAALRARLGGTADGKSATRAAEPVAPAALPPKA